MLSLLLSVALATPRIETFVLRGPGTEPVGVARVVAARGEEGKRLLEVEYTFFEGDLSIRHTEESYPARTDAPEALRAKLVWRELDDRLGRALRVERFLQPRPRLRSVDASRGDAVRSEQFEAAARACFPWTRLERVRHGGAAREVSIYLPLEGRAVTLTEGDWNRAPFPGARGRSWHRADGRVALRAWWVGRCLAGFQWNDGLVATRVTEERYRRLIGVGPRVSTVPGLDERDPKRERASDVLAFDRR